MNSRKLVTRLLEAPDTTDYSNAPKGRRNDRHKDPGLAAKFGHDSDEPDEVEGHDPDNEIDLNAESSMEEALLNLLQGEGYRCQTFESAGILTNNKGVVAKGQLGKFQITIVEDRRGY
jgi:hypothetical protein